MRYLLDQLTGFAAWRLEALWLNLEDFTWGRKARRRGVLPQFVVLHDR